MGAHHNHDAIRETYAELVPGLTPDIGEIDQHDDWPGNDLLEVADLIDHDERSYPWSRQLPNEDYLALLATTWQYCLMPEAASVQLFDRLVETLGDRIHIRGQTVLNLMRQSLRTWPRYGPVSTMTWASGPSSELMAQGSGTEGKVRRQHE